ncbi:MAG: response regulator [Ferruginibacter sp.]
MSTVLGHSYSFKFPIYLFSSVGIPIEESASPQFISLAQKARHKTLNIYLADDDSDDRDIFRDALAESVSGINLELAINGKNLISLLESSNPKPDIIFLDLNMPLKNGFECLEEIRKNKELKSLPIVIYSTTSNPEQVKKTLIYGANLFWQKPSDFNSIKKMLHKILHMPFDNYLPKAKKEHFILK